MANPSPSVGKRKFSDSLETQLPQFSVVVRDDSKAACSPGTTDLRADAVLKEQKENDMSSDSSEQQDIQRKKKSKKQKRKAKVAEQTKQQVIEDARIIFHRLKKFDKHAKYDAENIRQFDILSNMPMSTNDRMDFIQGHSENCRRYEVHQNEVKTAQSMLNHLLLHNPQILRHKQGMAEKAISEFGTFEQEFDII
jgi:chorismate mutase